MKVKGINRLGTQLGLAFASIILLLGGLALLAWGVSGKNRREARSLVEDRLNPVIQITTVREAQLSVPVRLVHGIVTGRLTGHAAAVALGRARAEADRQWQVYLTTSLLPDEIRRIQRAEAQLRALAPFADALQARMARLRPDHLGLEAWFNDHYVPAAEPLEATLNSLVQFQERTGAAMLQAMNQRQQRLNWAGGVGALAAIGLAAALAFRFANALGRHATDLVSHLQQTLINDVLTLSRMEAGRLELAPAPFAPGALAHDLKALFQLTAQGR